MKAIIFFLFSFNLLALTPLQKETIRSEVSHRIQNILNSYDPNAKVDLEIAYAKQNSDNEEVIENPFLFATKESKRHSNIRKHILYINASIFSKVKESKVPKVIKTRVINSLYQYSPNSKINYNYLKPEPKPKPIVKKIDNSFEGQFERLSLFEQYFIFFSIVSFFTWVMVSLMGILFKTQIKVKQVPPKTNPLLDPINRLIDSIDHYFVHQTVSPTTVTQEPLRPEKVEESPKQDQFDFTHEKEEIDFFSQNPQDYSVIHLFPSLGWLTLLSHSDISEILAQFTAEELAIAWEGPHDFLTLLANNLPLEKKEQLMLFTKQVKSSRDNAVFRELMICAEKKLRTDKSEAA